MPTTHFPNGVTNAGLEGVLATLTQPDPSIAHTYWNDFDQFIAADWVITETQAGATQALIAGDGGLLALTNSAADDDLNSIQKTPAAFAFTASKRAWFACRCKVSDATQSDVQVGIVIVDTTPLDATDGIYFQKDDGSTNVDIYVRKNATTGSNKKSAITTMANDTFITLAWYYDPNEQRVYYAVNGTMIGSMDASSTYLPDATNLTVSLSVQNGDANARTLTIDYVLAAFER